MIQLECDKCERSFDVDPAQAGGKVPCPHCGDVNRVPVAAGAQAPAPSPPPARGPEHKGLPPDSGPEQEICVIHPAMFRAHPFRFLLIAAMLLGGAALAVAAWFTQGVASWLAWPGVIVASAAVIWWLVWYVGAYLWIKLRISNKRTIRREGIIRRHTSEVLHDHVRNVEIRQTFIQRLFKVGYLGISSSGQDDIEIEVRDIPSPYEIKALIDEYRNM